MPRPTVSSELLIITDWNQGRGCWLQEHHQPVKVALGMRNKFAQTQYELLKWIKYLNPGLHTEHWSALD
jgi:hypothetical protein